MSTDARPAFIGDDWLFNDGWAFRETPPVELADAAQLESPLAWDRFLCVFLRAKRGELGHVGVLSTLLAEELPHPLFLATMYLGAAIGGAPEQQALERWLATDWFTQAAAAIVFTGELALVEALLERRRGADTEVSETMEGTISQLLEPEPDRFYETGLDDDAYDAAVRAEVALLRARHGADFRIVLGAPLRPRTLIAKLTQLSKLDRGPLDENGALVGSIALHLETFTGLPCKELVVTDGSGNEIVDRARLMRIIDAAETWDAKHRPRSGRRMFFGHAVP